MSNFETFSPITQGQNGTAPSKFVASTTDSQGTVTATGYVLDLLNLGQVKINDTIEINYADSGTYPDQTNTYGLFQVTAGGTLTQPSFPPTASTATYSGATVIGNFPKASSIAGQFVDSGISPTNASKTKAVMANGAVVVGALAQFTDTAGTVDDTGGLIPINTTVNYAGGSATPTITVAGSLTSSNYFVYIQASTNAVSVQKVESGSGNCALTLSGDPGAGTVFGVVGYL